MPLERDFEASSPYDETTQQINRSGDEQYPIVIDGEVADSEPPIEPAASGDQNSIDDDAFIESELHARTDDTFRNVEALFAPSPDGIKVPLFDPAVAELARATRIETSEDIQNILSTQADPDPLLVRLHEARQALDEKTVPWSKRPFDGSLRGKLKKERKLAQARFDHRRDMYIASKQEALDLDDPLTALTIARATLAEATYDARQGSALGMKRASQENLANARQAYQAAEENYYEEMFEQHAQTMTLEEEIQFTSSFKDHERGAMAGEEANLYLTEVNDDNKKSLFQKSAERFNKLSRKQKIVGSVAVAALAGIGFGAVGGAVAIGGGLAVKFARNTLNQESDRIGRYGDKRFQQEHSVLHAGNFDQSQQEHSAIVAEGATPETYDAFYDAYADSHDEAVRNESKRLSKEKRRVYGKAALYSAIPLVGSALLADHAEQSLHYLSHGIFRDHGLFGAHNDTSSGASATPQPHIGDTPDKTPNKMPEASTPSPESQSTPGLAPTPENTYLYGDQAGQTMSFVVPEGSSVWQQIDTTVSSRHPLLSYSERDRLVANIKNHIQRENPGVDLDNIPANTYISTNLPL